MSEFSFNEILNTQYEAWEKHKDSWSPMEPEYARNSLLWMIEELGEAIHIIKKQGEGKIMTDSSTREEFVTEMCDVLMYYSDVLLRYNITADELAMAFRNKQNKNSKRTYNNENQYLQKQE